MAAIRQCSMQEMQARRQLEQLDAEAAQAEAAAAAAESALLPSADDAVPERRSCTQRGVEARDEEGKEDEEERLVQQQQLAEATEHAASLRRVSAAADRAAQGATVKVEQVRWGTANRSEGVLAARTQPLRGAVICARRGRKVCAQNHDGEWPALSPCCR